MYYFPGISLVKVFYCFPKSLLAPSKLTHEVMYYTFCISDLAWFFHVPFPGFSSVCVIRFSVEKRETAWGKRVLSL